MASGDNFNSSVDPKIPVLKGETLKDFTRYKRAVQAAELGCDVLIEQTDPRDYAVEDGANVLLKLLETERFVKSSFRELPKAFDTFFDLAHFERKGEEPLAAFCTAMEVARRNLEEVDPDTKARADETFNFVKISTTRKNLFPRGGCRHRGQGNRTGWKWTMHANDTENGQADGEDPHRGKHWVQDDDGYWYECDDDRGLYTCTEEDEEGDWDSSHLFYLEDEADTFLAGEDDDYHQTLVTTRESRLKMNQLRAAKGFFKRRIDGVVDESAAAGGHAAGKHLGKGNGKGKDGGKSKDKRCSRPELEVMISSDVVPASLVASGASIAVAGRGWRDRVETELAKYGLRPIKVDAHQKFKGLGGARRESKQKWIILVGIGIKHALQEYFEIPGDMVGLTSRKDLAEWKTNLYMCEDGHWADFQELGVHGKELVKLPGGHAGLDLFDYDLDSYESEPLFERFRVNEMQLEPGAFLVAETLQEYEPGFQVKEHADSWSRSPAWFRSRSHAHLSNVQEFQRAQGIGDRVGDLIDEFKPLVDFSAKVLRTQAEGGRIGIGENPLTSRAWNEEPILDLLCWHGERPPLCEMFTLHQGMFGLTDDYGTPIRKATRMLVPSGSCFLWWLDRQRDQRHEHADAVGRGTLLSRASAWPDDLGKTLVSAGAHELARRTDLNRDAVTKVPDQRTMRAVAKEFRLRRDPIDVRVLRQNEAIPVPRGAVRRIYAMCTDTGVLADYSEACADDPNFTTVELAARYPTDTVVAIYVKEPKVQTSSPRRYPYSAADQKHSSTTIVKQTQYIETYIAKWGALGKLILNLSHPSAHAKKRRLKSYEVSQKVLDAVDKLDCVVCKELGRPNTTRSANLKLSTEFNGNVFLDEAEAEWKRAIDFFKNHFQRLNRDVQLTKSDDPSAWTSVIASTCNNHIRRNGFTPYQYVLGRSPNVPASLIEAIEAMEGHRRQLAAQSAALFEDGPRRAEQIRAAANRAMVELDSNDAVRRASVGRVRPPRGPLVLGQLAFYWREVKHVKSKRLQGEHGWRGPAIVLAAEGDTRLHLSYRGAPALATPEQVRHASRGEAEMVENEDLVRQLSQWREGPALQKGFVDERGPGPDGSGGQRDRRRKKDDGDSDNEDAVGDAPATKTYHHYLEMETACRTLEMEIHPEMETRLPEIEDDEIDDEVLFLKVKNRSRDAFAARRTDTAKKQVTPKKGRELRSIPSEWKTAFDASDLERWRKWIQHDAVEWPNEEEVAGVEKADILPMRRVRTNKNEPTKESLSYEQHPLKAKSRNIVPGYMNKQLLAGELQTNAPTLTDTATAVIIQEAASQPGWSLEQRDVDSAFLNGKYLDSSSRVYFRVSKGGMPAVPELGWPFVPEGTVLKAKKGIYGLNDAPLLWHEEHRDTILSLPGVAKLGKVHCYGKWQTAKTGFHRYGSFLKQNDDSTRIDLAFRLVESQARAHDSYFKVQDRLEFNKLVGDAKTDHVDITFQKLDMDNVIVVAVGDSSHGNVGKKKTASYPDVVVILAAETMAALEAVESGDMLRQHLVELHRWRGYRIHMDDVKAIKMVEVTECKSLYDLLQKRGTVPSETRLLIDIESLRNDMEFNSVVSKWVNTKQMLADCLTKQDVRAGDYMRYVRRTDEYRLTEDPTAEQVISEQRMDLKGRRGEHYRSKYPRRHRPADQPSVREGSTYFEDCIADLRYNARAARPAPKNYIRWRMMLGQREDMALEHYERDFTEKHNLKETDTTNDIEHQEDVNIISDENQTTDDTADLDDVTEIYMMNAAGAETEEI
ncbi:unnamed protein product, partial [Prorocentrum cordatum]